MSVSAPSCALLTGCSSGIGLATALLLRQHGWDVICCQRITSTEQLSFAGAEVMPLDLGQPSSIAGALDRIANARPKRRFDAVFLNAGYAAAGAIEDLPTECVQRQFQVNLFGHLQLLQGLLKNDLLLPGAKIVWCSSVLAILPMPMRGLYSATKAAMESIADTLSLELAHRGFFVSVVQPGPVLTNFRAASLQSLLSSIDWQSSSYRGAYEATIKRLGKPGPASPGTVDPEVVATVVLRCLQSHRPRARYRVTRATHVAEALRRLLPHDLLRTLIRRSSGSEVL